jgi:radical SAM PhpK family P-methyltransferase
MIDPQPTSSVPGVPDAPDERLDCVVIGYNESPFPAYEAMLRGSGESSLAYRDLKYSFVDVAGQPLTYVDLMNHARARGPASLAATEPFRSGDPPNLAAVYLISFLRRRGLRAALVNLFQDEQDHLRALLARKPRCVAITTTFYVLNHPLHEMIEFIRHHAPDVKIVVGGPLIANHFRRHVTAELGLILADIGADIYIHEAQGELTLSQLVTCLRDGGDLRCVPNLAFFAGHRLHRTATVAENNDLDQVDIDWLGFRGERLGAVLQTRTARSCAFKCAFCAYPMRAGKLTLASLDVVGRELDAMRAYGGVRVVVFIDDTFNVPLPRFKDLCRMMIERGYGFDWFSYFRCSNSDDEAIDLMARAGCKGVFLGIESGSPVILANMNKAATLEKYQRGVARLHDRGIATFGSFIVGFPGETAGTVDETIQCIRDLRFDYYRAQLWYCEPGTPIAGMRDQYALEGEGYAWRHRTMDSAQASAQVERVFRSIDGSTWLPQWSFDFWFLPYILGRGVSLPQFREVMRLAHDQLRLELDDQPAHRKLVAQHALLRRMTDAMAGWQLADRAPPPTPGDELERGAL